MRDLYLEIDAPDEPREPGRWFFHELVGLAVRSSAGDELGSIVDIYRAGGAEVFVVRGPRGELDVPGVRGIVLDLAPERGEMIVDLDALALDARPVEDEDYVRPRDRRPRKQPRRSKGSNPPDDSGPARSPGSDLGAPNPPDDSGPAHGPSSGPADGPGSAAGAPPDAG